jgi:tripartite tricarboxylate transporter TctB family protein
MTTERVSGVALALLAATVLEECWRLRLPLGSLATPGPAYMPAVLALAMLAAGVLIVVLGRDAAPLAAVGWGEWPHALAIAVTCGFVALALERLGYRVTMTLAGVFLLGAVERKPLATALAFSVGLAAGTYFVFDTVLRVPLPRGPFGF